ncbi:MAG: hypothetical protein ACJA11_002640 [Glaciecola sp.]|jgi:hypothetical protein
MRTKSFIIGAALYRINNLPAASFMLKKALTHLNKTA